MSHKNRVKFPVCPNCQFKFPEEGNNYCPNCGQENHDLNLPASHLFLELLENTLHFDTKFFRSLKYLLFYPGKLTAEFIANRRASYVPPFRLYVFISFFFFLLLSSDFLQTYNNKAAARKAERTYSITTGQKNSDKNKPNANSTKQSLFFGLVKFGLDNNELTTISQLKKDTSLDSVLISKGQKPTAFKRSVIQKGSKFLLMDKAEQNHKIIKIISLLMFVLMPLAALLLKLLYFRKKSHYIEHLIFSVHFHCFAFILIGTSWLLNYLIGDDWLDILMFWLILIYLFISLKTVFGQSKRKTFFKTIFLFLSYLVVLFSFIMVSLVISAALS